MLHEVLITRSSFLADKLRTHTERMLSTLSLDAITIDTLQDAEAVDYLEASAGDAFSNTVHALQEK